MTEWISVKDRLPKESLFYLIYMPKWNCHMDVCFYSVFTGWEPKNVYTKNMITHWMKLPDSPESEDKKDE